MKTTDKILCLGFNKTGTTSLHTAFQILGIKSAHYSYNRNKGRYLLDKAHQENKPLLSYMPKVSAYSDMHLYSYYKDLLEQYPEAYFILNTREPRKRSESLIQHRKERNKTLAKKRAVDKKSQSKEERTQKRVELEIKAHYKGVKKFIVMNLSRGDYCWEVLCPFLNIPKIPQRPFPHKNKGEYTLS